MFKDRKKLFLIIAVAALVCAAALMFALYTMSRPSADEGAKHITVEIVHGDGTSRTLEYDTQAAYLGEVLTGLIEGEQGQFGMYIHVVDGERAIYEEDGAYWALYEDGEYAAQSVDQTPVRDGAEYGLVYTRD